MTAKPYAVLDDGEKDAVACKLAADMLDHLEIMKGVTANERDAYKQGFQSACRLSMVYIEAAVQRSKSKKRKGKR